MKEVKNYKVKVLPTNPTPNSIYWVKGIGDTDVKGFITDLNGNPFPLKDETEQSGVTISNTDGNIIITLSGIEYVLNLADNVIIEGDNISDLTNDAGYITAAEVPAGVITQDITVSLSNGKTLGKYENGDTIPSTGMTYEELFLDIAQETINPTLIAPTFSVSLSVTGTREVGESYSATMTGNFNRGQILGDIVGGVWNPSTIQDFRAGVATSFTLDGTTQVGNTLSVSRSLILGTNIFNGTVNYADGVQPLNSVGGNFSTPLIAGSLNASLNITARRRQFFGATSAIPTNSTEVRALPQNNFDTTNVFTLVTGTTATKFAVAIPATKTITNVTDLGNLNANITSSYVLVNGAFIVNDIGGNTQTYKLYILEVGTPYAVTTNHQITTV